MDKVRVGIIGYGQIGPVHMRSYDKIKDKAEVVCVVDLEKEKAQQAQEQYGVPRIITDYKELMAMEDVDAISVCVPTYLHHEMVLAAAEVGKHVFCEKPMAMRLKDAQEMTRVCRQAGVKLQLGFVRRFDNEWLKFKELVTDGALGRPVVWRSVSAGQGAPTPWFFDRKLGGGPFMDGAVHNYDFGNFMLGQVKRVCSNMLTLQPRRTAFDTGVTVVEYESGDVLEMLWSWGLKKGCRGAGAHDVLGAEGALMFRAPSRDPLVAQSDEYGYLTISRPGGEEEAHKYPRNDMFKDEIESFVDSILEDREPLVGGKEGEEALKVALAVLRSAEERRPLELADLELG